jgi:hypothetical protein
MAPALAGALQIMSYIVLMAVISAGLTAIGYILQQDQKKPQKSAG